MTKRKRLDIILIEVIQAKLDNVVNIFDCLTNTINNKYNNNIIKKLNINTC